MSADVIKKIMVASGDAENLDELDWLTDEHIKAHEKEAKEKLPILTDEKGDAKSSLDYGNHFYKTNNGKQWHWESGDNVTGGNLNCGRRHKWRYDVRVGDSVRERGRCSGGYKWYEFNIFH